MRKNSKQRNVVKAIRRWYKLQGRTLPWRNISNPYRILISEIMLQQTQVSRVLVKYPEFLKRFPTLRSLANAKQRDVVLAWRGMGYNNRAVRLHKFAQEIVRNHKGKIPADFDSLIALPGIGKYTANALLSSAFDQHLPIVDVNVQRVLSRIFWRMKSTADIRSSYEIWKAAENILPRADAYNWNQALMDLGALICTANNPKCPECPVLKFCSSQKQMRHERRHRTRNEPSLAGIPNRIFRGRIIEHLRKKKNSRLDVLGNAIHPNFTLLQESWLKKLVDSLAADGLVTVKHNGLLQTSRISLA